jgi:hypothetical protein
MDKLKEKLHIGTSKAQKEEAQAMGGSAGDFDDHRESFDEELEAMTPEERVRYLKDLDHAEKYGEPKKGSFLERLIARGNKKTEDEIAADAQRRAELAKSEGLITGSN